ncbi:hypothetical protein EMIT0P218_60168 [Pseudomonas sp. IT-P218]
MAWIAERIAEALHHSRSPELIAQDVIEFMKDFRTLYFCHDTATH